MFLSQNKPQSVEPGVSSNPPQWKPPRHQYYATLMPQKDFSEPEVPVQNNSMVKNLPPDHFGVPIYDSANLKADVLGLNKEGVKLQSVAKLVSSSHPGFAVAKDIKLLENLYSTQRSVDNMKLFIVGGVPVVTVGDMHCYVLPKEVVDIIGESDGEVVFPLDDYEKISLFKN